MAQVVMASPRHVGGHALAESCARADYLAQRVHMPEPVSKRMGRSTLVHGGGLTTLATVRTTVD